MGTTASSAVLSMICLYSNARNPWQKMVSQAIMTAFGGARDGLHGKPFSVKVNSPPRNLDKK
jgi:hypothetical protein